jgi:hypothetical protein
VIGAQEDDEDVGEGFTDEEDEGEDEEQGIYGAVRPPTYHESDRCPSGRSGWLAHFFCILSRPCLSCDNGTGEPYACPLPVPDPTTTTFELCIPDTHRAPGHLQCLKCEKLFPLDEEQWRLTGIQCRPLSPSRTSTLAPSSRSTPNRPALQGVPLRTRGVWKGVWK